jgi:hypothetical protein
MTILVGIDTLGKALGDPGQFGRAVKAVHKRTSQERAVKVGFISNFDSSHCSMFDRSYSLVIPCMLCMVMDRSSVKLVSHVHHQVTQNSILINFVLKLK